MSALKRLASDTVVYGISSVVARLIGYLLVPYFTHIFLPEQYGLISLVFVALGIFNVFFTIGFESAFLKLASSEEAKNRKRVYSTLVVSLLGYTLFLGSLLWFSKSFWSYLAGIDDLGNAVILAMISILVADSLAVIGFASLRLQHRAVTFASLKLGQVALNAGLTVLLIEKYDLGIEGVFFANVVASVSAAFLVNILQYKQLTFVFDKEILKKALSFGLPFIPAGLAHLINESFDRYFLLQMDSSRIFELYGQNWTADDVIGIYSACYKLAVFALLLVQMFRMAWQPFFLEQSKKKDSPEVFAKVFTLFNALLLAAWLVVGLFAKEIAAITIPFTEVTLIGKQYWAGLFVVPYLLAAYVFQGWYVVFTSSIFIGGKTKSLAKVTAIGALITLIGNAFFTSHYGMQAAAVVTVLSYFVMSILLWAAGRKDYPIPYSFKTATLAFMVALGAFVCYNYGLFGVNDAFIGKLTLLLVALLGIAAISFMGFRSLGKAEVLKNSAIG